MKLFNKKIRNDFLQENLPTTRKEVFIDLIKTRFTTFLRLGLLLLLFCLPIIIALFFKDQNLLKIMNDHNSSAINDEEFQTLFLQIERTNNLIMLPCVAILFIGLSGISRINRELVWMNPLFFKNEFFTGVKKNFKIFFINSICLWILLTISKEGMWLIPNDTARIIPLTICLVLFFPLLILSCYESTIYNIKWFESYKFSFKFYFKSLWQSLVFSIALLLPLLILLIHNVVIKYVLLILFILILYPMMLLIGTLLSYSIFDKYLNIKAYPEIYNKGLNIKDK